MREELFKQAEEYDKLLNQGLSLSGENKLFFARGRILEMKRWLGNQAPITRILDFGCGIGDTTALIAEHFPDAHVVGVDAEGDAIDFANAKFATNRVTFCTNEQLSSTESFDLCYTNGVFHHIPPADRPAAVSFVYEKLRPGGKFAFFENNPLNPGTRILMSRIPFDRNAQMLTPWGSRKLLRAGGFTPDCNRFLFFFPRSLKWLRSLEPGLKWIPFGAQYGVMTIKAARAT